MTASNFSYSSAGTASLTHVHTYTGTHKQTHAHVQSDSYAASSAGCVGNGEASVRHSTFCVRRRRTWHVKAKWKAKSAQKLTLSRSHTPYLARALRCVCVCVYVSLSSLTKIKIKVKLNAACNQWQFLLPRPRSARPLRSLCCDLQRIYVRMHVCVREIESVRACVSLACDF